MQRNPPVWVRWREPLGLAFLHSAQCGMSGAPLESAATPAYKGSTGCLQLEKQTNMAKTYTEEDS